MDYLRGYQSFRRDRTWVQKFGLAALLLASGLLLPLVGPLMVYGWRARLLREQVRGNEDQLPALSLKGLEWMRLLVEGARAATVRLLWNLPALATASGLILGIQWAWTKGHRGVELSASFFVCMFLACLIALPALLLSDAFAKVASLRVELSGDVRKGLEVRATWEMAQALLHHLVIGSLLNVLLASLLVSLGLLAAIVGAFFMLALVFAAEGSFMAQLYRRWLHLGGERVASL